MITTRTVVVAPDGPLADAVLANLRAWADQTYLREFMWLTPADWAAEESRPLPEKVKPVLVRGRLVGWSRDREIPGADEPLPRAELLSWVGDAQPSLVRLIALQLLPTAESADLTMVRRAAELQRRLGPALVTEGTPDQPEATRAGARTVAVNLLVPATGTSGVPRDVLIAGAWITAAASAEDRASPRRTGAIVARPQRLAAHAALHVASAGALWRALADQGPFDGGTQSSPGTPQVVVARAFSRILQADEVVHSVAEEVLSQQGGQWSPPVKSYDTVVTPDARAIVQRATEEARLFDNGQLTLRLPREDEVEPPARIGIWESVTRWAGEFWKTTLSLPRIVQRRLALLIGQLATLLFFGTRHRAMDVTAGATGARGRPARSFAGGPSTPPAPVATGTARPMPLMDAFVAVPTLPEPVRALAPAEVGTEESGAAFAAGASAEGEAEETAGDADYEDLKLVAERRAIEGRLAHAERQLSEAPVTFQDVAVPQVWEMLQSVSFGLLDGGELPAGFTQPRQGAVHEVVADPSLLVPRPDDNFELSPESAAQLDLPKGQSPPVVRSCHPFAARVFGDWLASVAAQEREARQALQARQAEQAAQEGRPYIPPPEEKGPFEADHERFKEWLARRTQSTHWQLTSGVLEGADRSARVLVRAVQVLRMSREDMFTSADSARRRLVDGWMALLCGVPAFLAAALWGFGVVNEEGAGWIAALSWVLWAPLGGSVRRPADPERSREARYRAAEAEAQARARAQAQADSGTGSPEEAEIAEASSGDSSPRGRGRGTGRLFLYVRVVLLIAYLAIMVLVGYEILSLTLAGIALSVTVAIFALYALGKLRRYWFIPVIVILLIAMLALPLYRLGVEAVRSPAWWVIAGVVLWIAAWVAVYADYSREMHQFQTWRERLHLDIGNQVRTGRVARQEIRRLETLYRQFLDWTEIIGWVLHEPYLLPQVEQEAAQPDDDTGQRIHDSDSSGLAAADRTPAGEAGRERDGRQAPSPAHPVVPRIAASQVQHVEVRPEGYEEVRERSLRALRPRRWLSNAYTRCAEGFTEPEAIGSGRSPESDISLSHGPRSRLLEALAEGGIRGDLTDWALGVIESVVGESDPERLLTEVPGEQVDSPREYLMELEPTTPYLSMDDSLWTDKGRVHRNNRLDRIEYWVPRQLAEGRAPAGDNRTSVRRLLSEIRVHAGIGYAVQVARYDLTGPSDPDDMALFAASQRGETAAPDWGAEPGEWY